MSEFNPEVNQDNRDPRVACVLLLDTSWSMNGSPIQELNKGYEAFRVSIEEDQLARKRTEIAVITFGGSVELAVPFTEGRDLGERTFAADGGTWLGEALELALDQIAARKQIYKDSGLAYYRPWIFVITDGAPTDTAQYEAAAARVREAEARNAVTVFGVGVEGADMDTLAKISDKRPPAGLRGLEFTKLFEWLSSSMGAIAQSAAHGNSDDQIYDAEVVEMQELPVPSGWATW